MILVGLGLRIDAWSASVSRSSWGSSLTPSPFAGSFSSSTRSTWSTGWTASAAVWASSPHSGSAFLAYGSGRVGDAILGLALAGALAAFLRDNLPPARVYLGDAGSMTLGLMISALSVRACSDGSSNAVSLPPLLALLTLPLLDVVTAIGRRSITGRSVFTPDRGHIHHCLRSRLGSTVAALGAAIGLATLGAGAAALVKVNGLGDLAPYLAIVISVGLLVGTNTFGRSESRLLLFRIRTALIPLLTGGAVRRGGIKQACHLHGIRDWAGVWDALIREVEDGGVWRVELAIDMAAAGEVYHGLWILPAASGDDQSWSVVHNLYAGGVPAGVLHVAGSIGASQSHHLAKVEELVRMLEDQLGSYVPPPSSSTVPSPSRVPMSAPLT